LGDDLEAIDEDSEDSVMMVLNNNLL